MIIVTTIDHSDPDDSGKVSFSGGIPANDEDDNSIILKDIYKTDKKDEKGYPVYEGYVISEEDAANAIKKIIEDSDINQTEILLCIHGHGTTPCHHLDQCIDGMKLSEKYYLIPVLWPNRNQYSNKIEDLKNYWSNAKHSNVVGNALKTCLNFTCNLPVSVMAHSMGNRVLLSLFEDGIFKLSDGQDVKFDKVFMVAADVWEETFNERVIAGHRDHRDFENNKVGVYLMEATQKIIVVHAKDDDLLAISAKIANRWFCRRRRLGQFGAAGQQPPSSRPDRLHHLAKLKIIDVDLNSYVRTQKGLAKHEYQFSEPMFDKVYHKY